MGSNMKLAAERLYKIADQLEKEAADNTYFVCDGCNHTASLSEINHKRKTAGSTFNVKRIANVSVNDAVTCLACGGKMSYVPTESSQKYYVEAEDTNIDDTGDEDTGADIFEPVDERGAETPAEIPAETSDTAEPGTEQISDTPETSDVEKAPEETPAEIPEQTPEITDYDGAPEGEAKPEETPALEDKSEETPALEDKSQMGEGAPEGEDSAVTEETVPEDVVPEDSTSEDVAPEDAAPEVDSEDMGGEPAAEEDADLKEKGIELPKKDVPKFEKIPKEAQDAFWKSVAKYDI